MRSVREMAEEAGGNLEENWGRSFKPMWLLTPEKLERLVAIVRAEVLEEAAEVAEQTLEGGNDFREIYGDNSAVAIRALVKEK